MGRAPKGPMGRGFCAPRFLVRLGPITNYREILNDSVGRRRDETHQSGGLPVPIIKQDKGKGHVQEMDEVLVFGGRGP